MEWITNPESWIGLITLVALEVVLGIDNIVFISILSSKLPEEQQPRARRLGLLLAMGSRIVLLFSLSWIARLTTPLFSVLHVEITGRSLILILGGLFLLAKSTREIHQSLEGAHGGHGKIPEVPSFSSVLIQIMLLDLVFSLDSVITAVGMVNEIAVMVIAVVVAIGVMMAFAEPLSAFVERHPTVKMLALAFLLLIGFNLILDAVEIHVPKGYIYFAMGFSIFVEMLNLRARSRPKPVDLYEPYRPETA